MYFPTLPKGHLEKKVQPFEEIQEKCGSFLKDAGYKDLVYEESRENNTAWHFVYVQSRT